MRVAIPHNLDNDTVRNRLKSKSHEIGDSIPGGGAVRTMWPSDDRMEMDISAMGQNLHANVDLEPGQVVLTVDLPPALSFIEPMISGAIRQQGQKLLT
ncbi:hypothetical protein GRI40_11230 [Altererythrobacter aerius]|uniref:Polyhydroxyalkanoic acid system protein n=1 Tax=Tsuneonella aeria TaxID=1837929 RepID=A0A6I4TDX7_9SPHN|nr:polyhydroxyalkanoic acid system family protein [Tsuneonella aeria]MXO75789.1 hypothetical protein [Tsuneonella aeria]